MPHVLTHSLNVAPPYNQQPEEEELVRQSILEMRKHAG